MQLAKRSTTIASVAKSCPKMKKENPSNLVPKLRLGEARMDLEMLSAGFKIPLVGQNTKMMIRRKTMRILKCDNSSTCWTGGFRLNQHLLGLIKYLIFLRDEDDFLEFSDLLAFIFSLR